MHTHKWFWLDAGKPGTPISEWVMHCKDVDCQYILTWHDLERRLNAVEMLNANDAMKACQFIPQHEIPETGKWNAESRLVDALSEYARILEGQTTDE